MHESGFAEPTQGSVRELLRPLELLAELSWLGPERELSLPIPHDAEGLIDPDAGLRMAIAARADAMGLRRTLCSILERADGPVALSVLLVGDPVGEVADLARRVEHAIPGVRVIRGTRAAPGTHVIAEGEELPWGFPNTTAERSPPAVAYLLPGLPPEGSGGSHSLVQEARGLRRLGCEARICVPLDALPTVTSLYGNADELFVAYGEPEEISDAVGDVAVAVATEHPSLATLQRLSEARPELVCAYYVQDYEPLFSAPESARSDRALLSYRAIPGQVLFAKTHWLRNVVTARHGTPVAKVHPSLDRELFHIEGRVESEDVVRIAAMVRPRTPRRRPSATLQTLAAIRADLGERARTITFGCDADAHAELIGDAGEHGEHVGLLTRGQVADLMRHCDLFIDASAYQAFGRSGLEAMACGAVPVLPALGGVHEYAQQERNALIFEDDRPSAVADIVLALARDPDRLGRLRRRGLRTVQGFSIERAARSQLELFSAAVRRNAPRMGAPA
jgi:Glycosyl transferases group 1